MCYFFGEQIFFFFFFQGGNLGMAVFMYVSIIVLSVQKAYINISILNYLIKVPKHLLCI